MIILSGTGHKIEDIPIGLIKYLKKADYVFLESYTNQLNEKIFNFLKKIRNDIKIVDRKFFEEELENFILKNLDKKILLITFGNPLFATTHISLIEFCKRNNIKYKIIMSPSIFDYISLTGLSIYKFGRIVSIPKHEAESFFIHIVNNNKIGLHTLILLDIDLSLKEAIDKLINLSNKYGLDILNKKILICLNMGDENKIFYGYINEIKFEELEKYRSKCIIIPGNIDKIEEEFINKLCTKF